MQIDPALHTTADCYKLLTNIVVPRPIAWITSQNVSGVINLAPFSFFNAVGSNPLYVVVSVGRNDAGEAKDTARNIQANGEFVVNLVTEDLFDAMNISAADFPPDQSELEVAQLHTAPLRSCQDTPGGRGSGQSGMQTVQRTATRYYLHPVYRRSAHVPCRGSFDGAAFAHQQFCTHRTTGFAFRLLPHDRSL